MECASGSFFEMSAAARGGFLRRAARIYDEIWKFFRRVNFARRDFVQ